MPIDRFHIPIVSLKKGLFHAPGKVKEFQGGVVRGRDKFRVGGREGYVSHRIIVRLYNFDVVEIWLPILHHAVLVG